MVGLTLVRSLDRPSRCVFKPIEVARPGAAPSEAESFSGVSEQRPQTCLIKAQSTAIARAMASICNAERVRLGVVSGHERKTLSLSAQALHQQWRKQRRNAQEREKTHHIGHGGEDDR